MMQRNDSCKACSLRCAETKTVCLQGAYIGEARGFDTSKPTIMVVGLNPNPLEDMYAEAGRGDFKQLLNLLTQEVNVYYTSLTKCRTKAKINIAQLRACEQYFKQEYDAVKPAIIVALGEQVKKFLLGNTEGKRITRGAGYQSEKYGWVIPSHDGLTIYKQPWKKDEVFTDFYIATKYATRKKIGDKVAFTRNSVNELTDALKKYQPLTISVDIETDGNSTDDTLDPAKAWPWLLTLTLDTKEGLRNFLFDKIAFDEGMWDAVGIVLLTQQERGTIIAMQNGKFDLKFLRYHCMTWDSIEVTFDTQLVHHLINENTGHSLNHLEWRYLPECAGHKGEVDLGKKTAHEHDQNVLESYAVKDTVSTALLVRKLREAMPDAGMFPLARMISRASSVLASTEAFGCAIDTAVLQQQLANIGGTAFALEDAIRQQAQELGLDDFNPNSPTQVQQLLYRTLKLPLQYGEDGFVSTDDVALEMLLEVAESGEQAAVVETMRMHREYEKQRSTLASIKSKLHHAGPYAYVSTDYQMSFVVTGRLSSRNPNLQNIPKHGAVKEIFIPRVGCVFVEVDYKQAEYKVAAQMAQDQKMLAVLQSGIDFHQATVEALAELGCTVTRDKAKTINFAILYGAGDKKVSMLTKLSLKEVQYIQQMLKKAFPDFDNYFATLPERARRQGNSITGLFGRKRTVPYLSSSNKWWRSRGERQIVNSPVQGGASDLMMNAIVNVADKFQPNKRPHLALTVHDSGVWEVEEDKVDKFIEIAKPVLEQQEYPDFNLKFDMPIQVDIAVKRTSWGEKPEPANA